MKYLILFCFIVQSTFAVTEVPICEHKLIKATTKFGGNQVEYYRVLDSEYWKLYIKGKKEESILLGVTSEGHAYIAVDGIRLDGGLGVSPKIRSEKGISTTGIIIEISDKNNNREKLNVEVLREKYKKTINCVDFACTILNNELGIPISRTFTVTSLLKKMYRLKDSMGDDEVIRVFLQDPRYKNLRSMLRKIRVGVRKQLFDYTSSKARDVSFYLILGTPAIIAVLAILSYLLNEVEKTAQNK
ncbi:MAG: hypothetical protein H6621_05455 [Halobacteriovoraceae bacterium]|nr:hypothetical protein [Halobacteriovoraceae bacterium]